MQIYSAITYPPIRPVHTQVLQLVYIAFVTTVVIQRLSAQNVLHNHCATSQHPCIFFFFLQTLFYYNSYANACLSFGQFESVRGPRERMYSVSGTEQELDYYQTDARFIH